MHSPVLGCNLHLGDHKMLLGINVQTCAGYPFYVQNENCKGQSLFQLFSAAWIQTPGWLPVPPVCPYLPETSGYLVVCLHAALKLMCSTIYTAAVMCIWCHPCIQGCLISQLMNLLTIGLYNVPPLHAVLGSGEGRPHPDLPMQKKCIWGPHQNNIEKSYEISRWVCKQSRRFLPLCFPSCLPQLMLECSSVSPCGNLVAPAILPCLPRFLLNQVVKLVWINFFTSFFFGKGMGVYVIFLFLFFL